MNSSELTVPCLCKRIGRPPSIYQLKPPPMPPLPIELFNPVNGLAVAKLNKPHDFDPFLKCKLVNSTLLNAASASASASATAVVGAGNLHSTVHTLSGLSIVTTPATAVSTTSQLFIVIVIISILILFLLLFIMFPFVLVYL